MRSTTLRSVATDTMELTWYPEARLALVAYTHGATLTAADGTVLVDVLTDWIGTAPLPFGVLADAGGLGGTDAEYRARASRFFRRHRETAFIALFNVGPIIQIVIDLFRVGTGVPMRSFSDEQAARSWLRTRGIAA